MLSLGFALHIVSGFVSLVSGAVALLVRKGYPVHRAAGRIFLCSMMVTSVLAIYLAIAVPNQLVNAFIGIFVLYLIGTAWLTVHRKDGVSGLPEILGLGVSSMLCAPFAVLSFELAAGLPPFLRSSVPLKGPVAIAIYSFTGVLLLAAYGDAKVILCGGTFGARRIGRHLWRMCFGLTLTTGSAFTNGFARLLPGPYHVPLVFFLPQFIPLVFLLYWLIRIQFTAWLPRAEVA
jgi:uncharacterized membrane protein YfcA